MTKLGRKLRWVSVPHLPPPPLLYLYLKQLYARTKNSSFLAGVYFVGFFARIVETRKTGSNAKDTGGAVPPCTVVCILRDRGVSCPAVAAAEKSPGKNCHREMR